MGLEITYWLNKKTNCAICGEAETSTLQYDHKISLSIDHCHKTGSVRGMLCGNCNNGLGRFKDSTELLKNAINYLEGEK